MSCVTAKPGDIVYNIWGFDKIAPLPQIGSHRVHDSGAAADPLNTGFDRLMISPGIEFTKVLDEANKKVVKVYFYLSANWMRRPLEDGMALLH